MTASLIRRLSIALVTAALGASLGSSSVQSPRDATNLERNTRRELSELMRELRTFEREAREDPRQDRWTEYRDRKIRDHLGQLRDIERKLDRKLSIADLPLRLLRIRSAIDRLEELDGRPTPSDVVAGTGSISGRVTDAVTGHGVNDIFVEIHDSTGSWIAYDETNSLGDFSIPGLSDGTYYVTTFGGNPYLDELYDDIPCVAACDVTTGAPVTVAAGSAVSGIDFALDRGGSIQGIVSAADTGLPVSAAAVFVRDLQGDFVDSGGADDSGRYEVSGLSPGTYFAMAEPEGFYLPQLFQDLPCPGGSCDPLAGTSVSVQRNATTTGIDFVVTPGGLLSGTVTDALSGAPLAAVAVDIHDSDGGLAAFGSTNGAGQYVSETGLETGDYFVVAYPGQPHLAELYLNVPCYDGNCDLTSGAAVAIAAGSMTAEIDLALERGGTIAGTVVEAGSGYPIDDTVIRIYDSTGFFQALGTSDTLGRYDVGGLAPGNYFATAHPPDPYLMELFEDAPCFEDCDVTAGTPISVSIAATTPGIDFALHRGGTIAGLVTEASTGAPLERVRVDIFLVSGTYLASVNTDGSGVFATSSGLPTGTYFAATNNHLGYWDELFDGEPCPQSTCDPTSGTGISVTSGAVTTGVEFTLDTVYGGVLDFYTVDPCRLIDTRDPSDAVLQAGEERPYFAGGCGVPFGATAIAVNITVTGPTADGHLRLYPAGGRRPETSSINYQAGMTRSNNAVISLSAGTELSVFVAQSSGTVHLVVDVTGYFR